MAPTIGTPFDNPAEAAWELLAWMDETFDDVDLPLVFFDAAATIGYKHNRYYYDFWEGILHCPDGRVIETLGTDELRTNLVRITYPDGTVKDVGEIKLDGRCWVKDGMYYPSLYEALRAIAEKTKEDWHVHRSP